jgi:simple sugar transport system permease protein
MLWRRTRLPAFTFALAFHFINSRLFEIGIFPWMMIAGSTLFFEPDWPKRMIAVWRSGAMRARTAISGAAAIAILFGIFAIHLHADQIVTGTAINLLALGVTGFLYRALPGTMFSQLDAAKGSASIVFIAWIAMPLILGVLLWRTTFGLRLRACGENPEAVEAAGHSVIAHRWLALAIEAVAAGLAGGYLSLAYSGFAENMTAGRGFIALSIVIFGRWKVRGAIIGTALFGVAAALQYTLQAMNIGLPFHLLLAVPYVVTLLILCGIAGRVRTPEALGRRD